MQYSARLSQPRSPTGRHHRLTQRERVPSDLEPVHVARLVLWWHTCPVDATLVLGRQGRIVIPAAIRIALGLEPGDRLHLHVAGQRLVFERQQDAVTELRRLASGVPQERSLVDELIADRRKSAAAE
jgi:antitoxin PrlF